MSELYIIDRFEGGFAVIEHGDEMLNIKRENLPDNAKPGDVLVIIGGQYTVDKEQTDARRNEIRRLQNELFE